MMWFTWRQFRTQTWIATGAVALLVVLLVITGRDLANLWNASGAAACHGDCKTAVNNFVVLVINGGEGVVYYFTVAVMFVAPALIGIFWGAPLIAREFETGTYLLALNQSVTRGRWLATKLGIVATASAATAGLLSWAVSSWAHQIDYAKDDRITPLIYGARGIVPIGYALFAFTVGVTAGVLIRRTVPAMAATLGIYSAVVVSMSLWIRAHLLPATHTTLPLNTASVTEISMGGNQMTVLARADVPGAWVLSNQSITATGQVFTGPGNLQACGPDSGPRTCLEWIDTLGLRQDLTYQPASHFWALQFIETGIFLAASVLLAGLCFWWLRRRLT
jgi:hypothetical protein